MSGNQHCGRHDRIFTEENPCQGCLNEAEGIPVSSAATMTDGKFNENAAEVEAEETGKKKKSKKKNGEE